MKYSIGFKQGMLRKVLPPESRTVTQVSRETGIAEQTIRNWMERARKKRFNLTSSPKVACRLTMIFSWAGFYPALASGESQVELSYCSVFFSLHNLILLFQWSALYPPLFLSR